MKGDRAGTEQPIELSEQGSERDPTGYGSAGIGTISSRPIGSGTAAAEPDGDPSRRDDLSKRFEQLFRLQNDALVRMVQARLHDVETAKEVAQQAFEEVFKRDRAGTLTHLRAATLAYLRNYLFKTAHNIALDRLRARAVRIRDAHFIAQVSGHGESPSSEHVCIQAEQWRRVELAIKELPDRCRTAFLLVEIKEIPAEIVAKQMGVERNSVYQLCKRAYEHLMRAVSPDGDERAGRL